MNLKTKGFSMLKHLGLTVLAGVLALAGWTADPARAAAKKAGNKGGDRLKLDEQGKEVRVPTGEGDGSGHRYTGVFSVVVRDPEHPITKGMPREWMHERDELYDNMRGPIQNVHLLATAFSKG